MKYLHDPALAEITALLSDCPIWSQSSSSSSKASSSNNTTDGYSSYNHHSSAAANSRTLHGRLEAYTTKRAGTDKKYAVNVSDRYIAEQEAMNTTTMIDDKLSNLLQFQKDQTNSFLPSMSMCSRKRRSASTGEEPMELQKLRKSQIFRSSSTSATTTSTIGGSRRCRANSLDIPRTNNSSNTHGITRNKLQQDSSTTTTSTNEEHGTTLSSSSSLPTQPNFRALSMAAVNRRLLTDLILTLNHSFPDYDFTSAGINDFNVCSVQTVVTKINERLGEFSAATSTSPLMSSGFNKTTSTSSSSSSSGTIGTSYSNGGNFLSTLWKAVDNVIHLSEVTEVYSYQPSNAEFDDPHSFLKNSLVKGGLDDFEYNVVGNGSNINPHRNSSSDQYGIVNDDDTNEYDDDDDDDDDISGSYNKLQRQGKTTIHREVLWTFNYFFVNKHAKRILLFTCIETMTRSDYSMPPIIPMSDKRNVNSSISSSKSLNHTTIGFNAIPENEAVYHQLYNNNDSTSIDLQNSIPYTKDAISRKNQRRRRYKYLQRQLSSSIPSTSDNDDEEEDKQNCSSNDDDHDGGDDEDDDDEDDYEDDDSNTIASSSAVSVDFDLDPANAISGGIPIGN
jgi:hypothetical protein